MDKLSILSVAIPVVGLITSLLTEAVKKATNVSSKYYNLVASGCSVVASALFLAGYVILAGAIIDATFVFLAVVLVISSWVVAMVGYDKWKETWPQILAALGK